MRGDFGTPEMSGINRLHKGSEITKNRGAEAEACIQKRGGKNVERLGKSGCFGHYFGEIAFDRGGRDLQECWALSLRRLGLSTS